MITTLTIMLIYVDENDLDLKKNCLITTYKLYLCGTAVTILFNYLFNYLIPDERLSFIWAVSIH